MVGRSFWITCAGATLGIGFYSHTIAPLREAKARAECRLEETSERLQTARSRIKSMQTLGQESAAARVQVERLAGQIPDGSQMVWAPEQLEQHFRRFGFAAPIVRFTSNRAVPELHGFQRSYWSVGLPVAPTTRDLDRVLFAVAELEQSSSAFRIVELATVPDAEHPGEQIASVSVTSLTRE